MIHALHVAARRGHTATVKQLIQRGADVNRANEDGWTPLHYAAWRGHTDIINILWTTMRNQHCESQQGVDVNQVDDYGWTPLHDAAWHGHTEIVNILWNTMSTQYERC